MQPYQQATDEIRKQGEIPLRAIKSAASVAGGLAGASALGSGVSRVLPLLSQYLPEDLATKGLSKIDPRFGTFIDKAKSAGQSFDQIKEFIADKAMNGDEKQPEGKNIIQKYSDSLHQYLVEMINTGLSPREASIKVKKFVGPGKSMDAIKQIEKDYKTDFSDVVESIFGNGEMAQNGQQSNQSKAALQQPPQQNPQAKDQLLKAMQALSQSLKA